MPIMRNGNKCAPFLGDRHPVNIYKGVNKVAGWTPETHSGEAVEFEGVTYNDEADVTLRGNTVQVSDYYGKDGLSTLVADWHGVNGALSQVQTTQGKNLFDKNKTTVGHALGGLGSDTTYVTTEHGISNYISVLPSTTYYKSGNISGSILNFYTSSKEIISGIVITSGSFTTPLNCAFVRFNYAAASINTVQLELGSTATAYESFVPNSPSLEYPSAPYTPPAGKNLFNINNVTTRSNLLINNGDGTLTVVGYAIEDQNSHKLKDLIAASVGDLVTLSLHTDGTVNGIYLGGANSTWTSGLTKTITQVMLDSKVFWYCKRVDGVNYPATISNIQFEVGTLATTYELYKPRMAGNYKIADPAGGYWLLNLADDLRGIGSSTDKVELDLKTGKGKLRKNIVKKVMTGTENWQYYSGYAKPFYLVTSDPVMYARHPFICSHYKVVAYDDADQTMNYLRGAFTSFWLSDSRFADITAFKAWLATQYSAGTPVIVYYRSATEVVTNLTLTHATTSDNPEITLADLDITVPLPDYPMTLTSNLPAGTYKYTSTDGVYEFTLTDALRGINGVCDQVYFDSISHKGDRKNQCGKKVFNGTESISLQVGTNPNSNGIISFLYVLSPEMGSSTTVVPSLSTHLITNAVGHSSAAQPEHFVQRTTALTVIYIHMIANQIADVATFKSWLAAQYAAGNPVTVEYVLGTPTKTEIIFTKVASSTSVEVPMGFITSTPSLDYPATVYDSVGNFIARGKNLFDMASPVIYEQFVNAVIITDKLFKVAVNYVTSNLTACWCFMGYSSGGVTKNYFPAGTYTIAFDIAAQNSLGTTPRVDVWFNDRTNRVYAYGAGHKSVTIIHTGGYLGLQLFVYSVTSGANSVIGDWISVSNVMLVPGSMEESFSPYRRTTVAFPALRKIEDVCDQFIPKTGKHTKKISDLVTLFGGGMNWGPVSLYSHSSRDPKRLECVALSNSPQLPKIFATKFDSTVLTSNQTTAVDLKDSIYALNTGGVRIMVANEDSGFGGAYMGTADEVKAYFYGWKMCHTDGLSPYYRSEIPYDPVTWAEWSNYLTTPLKDSTGVTITSNGTSGGGIVMNTTLKASTKYGLLYNVVSNTIAGNFGCGQAFNWQPISKNIGNNKFIITTLSVIIENKAYFYIHTTTEPLGNFIKLKDIRIFELPAGSQIESDFTNLTADQLAAKYTFHGLCTKCWKHVTDGQLITSALPTATYDGYTPYKMLYQLATPVEEYLTPTAIPTYYNDKLILETDAVNAKPTIEAMARVIE